MQSKKMEEDIQDLFDFIQESPTAFHAVAVMKEILKKNGFIQLSEKAEWNLVGGHKYFVTRNDSSVMSFVLPKNTAKGFHIVASHTDSPSFKVKANPEIALEDSYVKLNVEKYGGMILSTWFDRPLSVAGRVFVESNNAIESRLVNVNRDLAVIPNLAIHMNRDINKGVAYNPQIDLLPVFSEEASKKLNTMLAKELNVSEESILSEELYLYNRQSGCIVGAEGEWIMAPRLDDLQCVYASLMGILDAKPIEQIALSAFFDNEEVGSSTKQGANSDFLETVTERICNALSISKEVQRQMLAQSFLISADNAHALHPNHPEKADLTNRPKMNGGIVVKYHGGQKYTTDGYSSAYFIKLCQDCGISHQTYCNRSDILGGSTLGNISTAHISVPSVDIGFAQLAMHSAMETAGRKDIWDGIQIFKAFFSK